MLHERLKYASLSESLKSLSPIEAACTAAIAVVESADMLDRMGRPRGESWMARNAAAWLPRLSVSLTELDKYLSLPGTEQALAVLHDSPVEIGGNFGTSYTHAARNYGNAKWVEFYLFHDDPDRLEHEWAEFSSYRDDVPMIDAQRVIAGIESEFARTASELSQEPAGAASSGAKGHPTKISLALAILQQSPHLTNKEIAEQVGCTEQYLKNNDRMKKARAALRSTRGERPRGSKYNGHIEAETKW